MNLNIKNYQTIYFYITLSLIISLLVLVFEIRPSILEIKDLEQKIANQHSELENKFQNIKWIKQNKQQLKNLESQLPILNSFFIKTDEELNLIAQLENIATQNQVEQDFNLLNNQTVKNTATTKIASKEIIKNALTFEIKTTGQLPNIINYLLNIEQLNYYLNFDSLKITRQNLTGQSTVEIRLTGKIYLINN